AGWLVSGERSGAPVDQGIATSPSILNRSSVESVCHGDRAVPGDGGRGRVRPGSSGRADPVPTVRAGRCRAGADRGGAAADAGAAVTGGDLLHLGDDALPRYRVLEGLGQDDRRAGGAEPAASVGEGAAGSAPPARPGPGEGPVRVGRGPAGLPV